MGKIIAEGVVRVVTVLLIIGAIGVGAISVIQTSVNGEVRVRMGDAWQAALFSTMFSTISLFLISTVISRKPLPNFGAVASGPWWLWTGGLMGAAFVAFALTAVSRLGSTVLFALIIFGQLITSVVMDHFGLLGLEKHPISPVRVLGVGLLLGGVVLLRLR